MTEERVPYEVFTTPVGEFVYPRLTQPDTRYDPDGVYQLKLLLPFEDNETQELIAKIDGVLSAFIQTLDLKVQNMYRRSEVYEKEMTEDGTAETGNVLFKMKMKAKVTHAKGSFEQAPVVVMADTGEKVEGLVYGGSFGKVKGQIVPYTMAANKLVGVTLRLKAVQIHELQSGTGDSKAFWTEF